MRAAWIAGLIVGHPIALGVERQEWIVGGIKHMMIAIVGRSIVFRTILVNEIPAPCHAKVEMISTVRGMTKEADLGRGGTRPIGDQGNIIVACDDAGRRSDRQAIGIAFAQIDRGGKLRSSRFIDQGHRRRTRSRSHIKVAPENAKCVAACDVGAVEVHRDW